MSTDSSVCPHCSRPSSYAPDIDRYIHEDGSAHVECWLALARGDAPVAAHVTDLYRFYDADERLLYVGISLHAAQRAARHRQDKLWWSEVARMEVAHLHVDRREAEAIERLAIIDEKPKYNVVHNTDQPTSAHVTPTDKPIEFNASVILRTEDVGLYNTVGTALDAIARRLDGRARNDEEMGSRQDFVDTINGLVRALVYGDCCHDCMQVRFPVVIEFTDRQAHCGYYCDTCDKKWASYWTLDIALLAGIG